MKIYMVKGPENIYYARILQPNEKWTRRSLQTSNETEAKVRLGELSYQLKQKGWEVPKVVDTPALKELTPAYLAYISPRKAASWVNKQRQYLTGCVTTFFGGDTKISAISPGRLEAYANDRCETVRGPLTASWHGCDLSSNGASGKDMSLSARPHRLNSWTTKSRLCAGSSVKMNMLFS